MPSNDYRSLGSAEPSDRLAASGALTKLAELTRDHANHPDIAVQAAMAIGSLAFGTEEHVAASCNKDVVAALVVGCSSANHAVVLACVRTLRTMYKTRLPPTSLLFEGGGAGLLNTLLGLLGESETATECAASLLAKFCSEEPQIATLVQVGAAKRLSDTLQCSCRQECSKLAVLSALTAFTSKSAAACEYIATSAPAFGYLFGMLRSGGSSQLGLLITSCIANIFQWKASSPSAASAASSASHPPTSARLSPSTRSAAPFAARRHVILIVLALVKEQSVRAQAAKVFVKLVKDDVEVQELLCTLNMLRYISLFFGEGDVAADSALLRERGLEVMAAYTNSCNNARFQVKESAALISEIKQGLCVADSAAIRLAACNCVLSLSRSVKVVRKELVESRMAMGVAILLDDPAEAVQEAATAALCNMLLEYTPLRKDGLDLGAVEKIARHLGDGHGEQLRINSAWALKNLLYSVREKDELAADVKEKVLAAIPWSTLSTFLTERSTIQEHAAGMLQNLLYGSVSDVAKAAAGFGGAAELVNILGRMLASCHVGVVVHALYAANNVAAEGECEHKDALVANRVVMALIVQNVISPVTKVQIAAIWCVRNLTLSSAPGAEGRQMTLLSNHYILRQYLDDVAMQQKYDVKAHARSALNELQRFVEIN
eukprot:gene5473-12826_t